MAYRWKCVKCGKKGRYINKPMPKKKTKRCPKCRRGTYQVNSTL